MKAIEVRGMKVAQGSGFSSVVWSLLRSILLLTLLLHGISARAHPAHEELEPNDTPAAAFQLAGGIRIRGAFAEGDKRDAYIGSVSEADSGKRWAIRLHRKEGFRTFYG